MAKKKKKKSQAFTMIVLFLVIIVLVIGYFVAKGIAEKAEGESADSGDKKLVQIDTSKAKTLTYSLEGKEVTLVKDGDTWKVENEKDRPLDQEKVQSMVDRFSEMTAAKEVYDNQEKLADVGLTDPALTVTLTLEDGATYSYSTGAAVVTSDGGCYAIVKGYPGIYILPEGYYTLFRSDLNEITELPEVNDIQSGNITKVRITKDGNVSIDVAMDPQTKEWVITKPYDSSVRMDVNNMNTLTSTYVTYKFIENIDYNCTDFSKYGLENPATEVYVEYFTKVADMDTTEEHKHKLSVGKTTEDGSLYYVRLNDSNSVYTMSAIAIHTLTTVDAFSYIRYALVDTRVSELAKATFMVNGKTYELQIDKNATTVTDDAGNEVSSDAYKLNGVEKKPSDVGTFYNKASLIKIVDQVKDKVDTSNVVCSIHITDTNGKEFNYNFYDYDASYYAVEQEGLIYFTVDKSRVDDMIRALEML